jgi:hypothetical protein
MLGKGSYSRLLNMFQYLLISRTIPPPSRASIMAIGPEKAPLQIAQQEVINATNGINWFEQAVLSSSHHCLDVVLNHLLRKEGPFALLAQTDIVRDEVALYYKEAIRGLIEPVVARWRADIAAHSSNIEVDMPIKRMLSVVLVPQDNLIPNADGYNPLPPVRPDSLLVDEMPLEKIDPIPGDVTADAAPQRDQRNNPDHWQQMHMRVSQARRVFLHIQSGMGWVDYVDAGHAGMPHSTRRNFDDTFIKSAALEYYVCVMDTVIRNLEVNFMSSYFKVIEHSSQFLSEPKLLERLRGKSYDGSLVDLINVDVTTLTRRRSEINSKKEILEDLQRSLRNIRMGL